MEELKKYKWMIPLISGAERNTRRKLLKNLRKKKDRFYPEGGFNADIKNLINCMLCPNMCRFDCNTLQAAKTEVISPAYKARIGYYLTVGKIDPSDPENKEFVDLMYKCSNCENCKIWCPFDFSVVSLLETVRDDLNEKGLMPDYCEKQIDKLKETGTIEDYNIFKTYEEKGIENIETDGNDDVFYYIGCEMMKFPKVVQANIELLKKLGIKFSTNLDKRVCCGSPALNIRDLDTITSLASKSVDLIRKSGAKLVISGCPGCVRTLTERYQKNHILEEKVEHEDEEIRGKDVTEEEEQFSRILYDEGPEVIHIVEYIERLLEEEKLMLHEVPKKYETVTIHDPCLLARNLSNTSSIRKILGHIPNLTIKEPIYNKEFTHCCGWSGTVHWADRDIAIKESENRISELKETGANIIVTACPECELGLAYGIDENEKDTIEIIDLSELLIKAI
ncbi:MAG: (Fe-S)-binding protein [Promethearchaeota archaeon]|nr:MAG: (Fe-S)-binding protein [Candidatus Lokiarchaeota archaeon]